jgi:hypothetical protein
MTVCFSPKLKTLNETFQFKNQTHFNEKGQNFNLISEFAPNHFIKYQNLLFKLNFSYIAWGTFVQVVRGRREIINNANALHQKMLLNEALLWESFNIDEEQSL